MAITRAIDIDALAEDTIHKIQLHDRLTLPLNKIIELVHQLKEFELGRFMLTHGALTSACVDYICHNEVSPTGNALETWFLSKAPKMLAARERYYITQQVLQPRLQSNMMLCILPCGVISKIAELDYSNVSDVRIIGYDYDIHGLVTAELKMQPLVDQKKVMLSLLKKNLWDLDDVEQHDVIVSNRLSALESNPQKVAGLFRNFYRALKPGGVFVCSFFTPSPLQEPDHSPWSNIHEPDMLIEHSIFVDIMNFHPAARSESDMVSLLEVVGFEVVDLRYDSHKIYPTVVAQKP